MEAVIRLEGEPDGKISVARKGERLLHDSRSLSEVMTTFMIKI